MKRWSGGLRRALRAAGLVVAGLALAEGLVALLVRDPARGIHFAARSQSCCALDPALIWRTRAADGGAGGAAPATPDRASAGTTPAPAGAGAPAADLAAARVTRDGLRGPEPGAKVAGELRVLAVGDDATFGSGLAEADAYPARLEAELRAAGVAAHVLNAGQPGYGSDQELRAFELRWASLAPDAVVVGVHCSDLAGDLAQPLFDVRGGRLAALDPRFDWIYLQGLAFERAPELVRRLRLYRWLLSRLDHADPFGQLPPRSEEGLRDWQRDKIALELAGLTARGQEHGYSVAAIVLPCLDAIGGVPSPPLYGDLAARLERAGVPTLDAGAALRASGADPTAHFQPLSQLLDAEGNAALARAVAAFLRQRALLPEPAAAAATPRAAR